MQSPKVLLFLAQAAEDRASHEPKARPSSTPTLPSPTAGWAGGSTPLGRAGTSEPLRAGAHPTRTSGGVVSSLSFPERLPPTTQGTER